MKKTVAILLLTLLVVGCGTSVQMAETDQQAVAALPNTKHPHKPLLCLWSRQYLPDKKGSTYQSG